MSDVDGNQDSFLGDRYEFKYILNHIQAQQIQNHIESIGIERDDNSKTGSYIVNSMYFDTPFLDDYQDKEGSLLIRKKMRARTYEDCWGSSMNRVWLEIKNKRNFSIFKERTPITSEQWRKFILSNSCLPLLQDFSLGDQDILKRFSYIYTKDRYEPHVIVKYNRAAYLVNHTSKVRITFDRNIRTGFVNDLHQVSEPTVPVTLNETIMEVKFREQLPYWFTDLVNHYEISRMDFSKYNYSVAKLRDLYRIPVSK